MRIRLARLDEAPALRSLIDASVRALQANDYTPAQMEGALGTVLGLDTQLIADGTYFVVEVEGQIAACGGWSRRRTLFGSDHGPGREDAFLDPTQDAAKIRAFFVHPDYARRGIGTQLLAASEQAARNAGFTRFEMGATLTGVPLSTLRGYRAVERVEVPLKNGEFLGVVKMVKGA
ncbi:MAG: GNAT family N-acetyltransferase [Bryobacteraceae bacterium]|nr:GNAT family N-acetyltransferase [Bryobacteraceae bacterium]